ncbi:hypothetical protein D3C84_1016310 [compost metagenome]
MVDADVLGLALDLEDGDRLARACHLAELDDAVVGVGIAEQHAAGHGDGLEQGIEDAHAAIDRPAGGVADHLAGLVDAQGIDSGKPGALGVVVELGIGQRIDAAGEVGNVGHEFGAGLLVVLDVQARGGVVE